jgi:hypothetical protein
MNRGLFTISAWLYLGNEALAAPKLDRIAFD